MTTLQVEPMRQSPGGALLADLLLTLTNRITYMKENA